MTADFHFALPVSRSWYCACWLTVTLLWQTEIINTCTCPALTDLWWRANKAGLFRLSSSPHSLDAHFGNSLVVPVVMWRLVMWTCDLKVGDLDAGFICVRKVHFPPVSCPWARPLTPTVPVKLVGAGSSFHWWRCAQALKLHWINKG